MTADVAHVIGTFFADPPNYSFLTYKVTNDRDSRTLVHLCTCVCARSRSMHNRYCSYESGQAHRSNVSAAILILVNEERDLLVCHNDVDDIVVAVLTLHSADMPHS